MNASGLPEAPSPFLSDAMWLLTTGPETRKSAPQTVLLGVAAAGLCDLEAIGEVSWSGLGQSAPLVVRETCRCEDGILGRWHHELIAAADGNPLLARFTLAPLVRSAWHDTARRLAAKQLVTETEGRLGLSRESAFTVRDSGLVVDARRDLERALEGGEADDRQHDLVVVAWASGCFDDLFNVHGWEASSRLLDAARSEALEDATFSRISAATGFSGVLSARG